MANFNSVELAQIAANPADPIDVVNFGGRIRFQLATVVVPASGMPAATDTIQLFRIPAGGRIVGLWTAATASLSTGTFSIGDAAAAAKFRADAAHTTTALTLVAIPGTATTLVGFGLPYTANTPVFATVGTNFVAGGPTTVLFLCQYVVD